MVARCFLDTNILVYAAAGRDKYPHEHAVESRIVAEGAYSMSAQRLKLPVLDSQDMSHRQECGSVTVINPFEAA